MRMAVLLSDLYESVKSQDMTLVAGEQGMNNIVRWLHMVESNAISSFLGGQEIAFTTGVALGKDEQCAGFIHPAVAIQPGCQHDLLCRCKSNHIFCNIPGP